MTARMITPPVITRFVGSVIPICARSIYSTDTIKCADEDADDGPSPTIARHRPPSPAIARHRPPSPTHKTGAADHCRRDCGKLQADARAGIRRTQVGGVHQPSEPGEHTRNNQPRASDSSRVDSRDLRSALVVADRDDLTSENRRSQQKLEGDDEYQRHQDRRRNAATTHGKYECLNRRSDVPWSAAAPEHRSRIILLRPGF